MRASDVGNLVGNGPLFIAIPLALAAGLVSFLSPCIMPLVPGYLGYIGGATGSDGTIGRRRLLLGVGLFVLGFTLVFTTANLAFGALGTWLSVYREALTRIAGVIVIALGLVFVGQFTFLQRTVKPRWMPATGLFGAPLLGVIFAIGWTPCLGPTLVAITSMSLQSGSVWEAVLLGIFYSLGLGIPFLLIALGFGWVATSVNWVKRHIRLVNIIGGSLLIVIGLLMVSGLWTLLMSQLGAVINVVVTPL
jgi:cytochrome c-type biogenesis protein